MQNLVISVLALLISVNSFAASELVKKDIAEYQATVAKMKSEFTPGSSLDKAWVIKKLQHMVDVDQYSRLYLDIPYQHGYSAEEKQEFTNTLWQLLKVVDIENTEDLKPLLKIYSWFTISEFDRKTDNNAWLLVQHADHDPDFQKSVLPILEKLYPLKETRADNYAYLFDRVAASWGDPEKRKLQRYGTQGMCVGPGAWAPLPVEDEVNLDQRRAAVGLGPEADYIALFKDRCKEDQR